MTGKIILNLAVSLDGYIADKDGGYGWIVEDGIVIMKYLKK